MRPVVNQFFLVFCDFHLVQNQTFTVQNGAKCREFMIWLAELMLCLMSLYEVKVELIGLENCIESTSYFMRSFAQY